MAVALERLLALSRDVFGYDLGSRRRRRWRYEFDGERMVSVDLEPAPWYGR